MKREFLQNVKVGDQPLHQGEVTYHYRITVDISY